MALKGIIDPATGRLFHVSSRQVIGTETVSALGTWKKIVDASISAEHRLSNGRHEDERFCKAAIWIPRPDRADSIHPGSQVHGAFVNSSMVTYRVTISSGILRGELGFPSGAPGSRAVLNSVWFAFAPDPKERTVTVNPFGCEFSLRWESAMPPVGVLFYA